MENKANIIFNSNQIYIVNVSDLIVVDIYDETEKPNFDEKGKYIDSNHILYTHLNAYAFDLNYPLSLRWVEKNGEKYLEEILTGTKINVITSADTNRIKYEKENNQINKEGISHIETFWNNDIESASRIYIKESQAIPQIYNNGNISLAIFPDDLIPLSDFDYNNRNIMINALNNYDYSEEIKSIVESLKNKQHEAISTLIPKVESETKQTNSKTIKLKYDPLLKEYRSN